MSDTSAGALPGTFMPFVASTVTPGSKRHGNQRLRLLGDDSCQIFFFSKYIRFGFYRRAHISGQSAAHTTTNHFGEKSCKKKKKLQLL